MEDWVFFVIIAVILTVSMIGAGVVLWFLMKNRRQNTRGNYPKQDKKTAKNDRRAFFQHKLGKVWLLFAVCWPLACVALGCVILYQSLHGIADRDMLDVMGVGVGLVFFIIGMAILYISNKRRVLATAAATATVVGFESYQPFQEPSIKYKPVYEFYAEGATYKVTSRHTERRDAFDKGQEAALYYVPGRPALIYEPKSEKRVARLALAVCGIGIFFPFLTTVAPWIAPYIS